MVHQLPMVLMVVLVEEEPQVEKLQVMQFRQEMYLLSLWATMVAPELQFLVVLEKSATVVQVVVVLEQLQLQTQCLALAVYRQMGELANPATLQERPHHMLLAVAVDVPASFLGLVMEQEAAVMLEEQAPRVLLLQVLELQIQVQAEVGVV